MPVDLLQNCSLPTALSYPTIGQPAQVDRTTLDAARVRLMDQYDHRASRLLLTLALMAWALTVTNTVLAGQSTGWRLTIAENGVRVFTRPGKGHNLPQFKGIVRLDAKVLEVLAILDDIDRACEWTERCVVSKELKRMTLRERIFYHRTVAMWPFDDRDVVLRTQVRGLPPGNDVVVSFRNIDSPLKHKVAKVVRMPTLVGYYRVLRLGPNRTEVTFHVSAHPGGHVPDWIAAWVAKRMPLDTLVGLRVQVKRTRGRYRSFVERHKAKLRPPRPVVTPEPPVAKPAKK